MLLFQQRKPWLYVHQHTPNMCELIGLRIILQSKVKYILSSHVVSLPLQSEVANVCAVMDTLIDQDG